MEKPVLKRYEGLEALVRMQALTQSIWTPECWLQIGDLAWDRLQHVGRDHEWVTAVWEIADRPVAWGWIDLPDYLTFQVDPELPELATDVLNWFEEVAEGKERTTKVLETETHLIDALERAAYVALPNSSQVLMKISMDALPTRVQLPDGFVARHIQETTEDIANRVAVHRAAFAPSRVTEGSYRNVMNAYPYDASLDWVIVAPNGEFAAFCLIWYDDVNKVGVLEPVGTHPDYRRLGLASTVCTCALQTLQNKGAAMAFVSPGLQRRGKPYTDAFDLYTSIGFEVQAYTKTFVSNKHSSLIV